MEERIVDTIAASSSSDGQRERERQWTSTCCQRERATRSGHRVPVLPVNCSTIVKVNSAPLAALAYCSVRDVGGRNWAGAVKRGETSAHGLSTPPLPTPTVAECRPAATSHTSTSTPHVPGEATQAGEERVTSVYLPAHQLPRSVVFPPEAPRMPSRLLVPPPNSHPAAVQSKPSAVDPGPKPRKPHTNQHTKIALTSLKPGPDATCWTAPMASANSQRHWLHVAGALSATSVQVRVRLRSRHLAAHITMTDAAAWDGPALGVRQEGGRARWIPVRERTIERTNERTKDSASGL